MKSMMRRTTLREIRQSFGRFFAIFSIVALGVGFFAGIRVTRTAMVATTQQYFEKHQLFDYRMLSTLGFEEEDVVQLQGMPDVRAAQGAVSFDILYENESGNEAVIRAHSLTEGINGIVPVEGRMPEKADECVVDSSLYTAEQIGEKIVLSANNEEADDEKFAYSEYTITGIVNASYYIQFERGNTSLGTGQVGGFMYLLPEGFETEYYTEVFVKFDEDLPLYSAEYDAYMDAKEQEWKVYGEKAADRRYQAILAEANDELEDARTELADKKAEAEKELADAKAELDEAALTIQDGEAQLADAKADLAEAENTITEKEAELSDAEVTIAEEEKTLTEKEQELADGQKLYDEQNYVVEKNKGELGKAQDTLDAGKVELEKQASVLEDNETLLVQKEEELNQTEEGLKLQFGGVIPEPYASAIAAGRQEIALGREQIAAGKVQIEAQRVYMAEYQAQLNAGMETLKKADKQLGEALAAIQDGKVQIEDGKQQLADAKTEVADGRVQLTKARTEIKNGRKEIQEKSQELLDGKAEYEDGLAEYEDALTEFETEIAEAEAEIADAQAEINDIEEPDTYVLDRNTNVGYACLDNDSAIVQGISNIFPVFFFLVAALVCITTMNRMVEEQRTQIGVLKALGYRESTIMGKYLFYSGSATFAGCISGFAFGTYFLPRIIWTVYGMMYKVTPLVYVFDWWLAAISLAVSLLCSLGSTWMSCRYELTEAASELMRPKAPKAGKRVILEYVTPLWKRLKFLQKVTARNIFRYKKRFFMMVIGISGCTALLVTGFGMKDSVANIATQQFEEIQIYDIGVTFKKVSGEKEQAIFAEALEGEASDFTYVAEKSVDLIRGDHSKALNLIVVQDSSVIGSFLDFHTKEGVPLAFPQEGEAIISHKIARNYDIHVGDELVLQDDKIRQIAVTVTGINQNFINDYIYMNDVTYRNSIQEEPEYKSAYINLEEGADAYKLAAAMMKLSHVTSTTVNADTEERFSSMMSSLNYIVLVVLVCAAGLAFIVLYNLTNINITERIREIATIKVLGFYKKETASYVFRENMILTLFGTGTGLILGYFLHRFVMSEINVEMVAFDTHIAPLSYFLSIVLTFAFAWSVNLFMAFKLEGINMAESLKSVD